MNASAAASTFSMNISSSAVRDLAATERLYNSALNAVFVVYIPVMAVCITLIWGFTPKTMNTFKYTVSNMIFWIAMALLYVAFFFRPMLVSDLRPMMSFFAVWTFKC